MTAVLSYGYVVLQLANLCPAFASFSFCPKCCYNKWPSWQIHDSLLRIHYSECICCSEALSILRLWNCFSVAKLCPAVCNPVHCSMPGFPVLHYLPEFAEIHVHWVGDAIQPPHPLSPPSPPALNLSQHQGLFQRVSSSHQVAKVLALQLQHQSFQWIFRTDFLEDWLVWSPCNPRDSQESSRAPQFESINSFALSLLYGPILRLWW